MQLKRRRWPFVVGSAGIALLAALPIVLITAPAIGAASKGLPLPAEWTWTRLSITDALLLALCALGFRQLRRQFQVRFSDAGVHQGRRFMKWDEISEIRRVPQYSIELRGAHGKITVNCWAFQSPNELFALIKERARHAREA